MELRIAIDSLSDTEVIERKQTVKFNTFDLDKYRDLFMQLANNDRIYGSFDEVHWELPCNISNYMIGITFDIEVYRELNTALKAYSVVRLLSGRSPITVYNEVALLKKAILESDGFKDLKKLEVLLELQNKLYSYQGYQMSIDLKRFISFYNINNAEIITDICNNLQSFRKKARTLPEFEDIMIFDEVVNDYFQNYPVSETIEFLPIMLWWLLTNVLPMRPTEFLSLKKDCLKDNEDGDYVSTYHIQIPRIKNRTDSANTRRDYIDLDKRTYNLIKNAIEQLNMIDSESQYLFPVELLLAFRKNKRKKKNKRINRRDFDLLKSDFYEKVVEGIYGKYDLERIKSADTRHFAIINMALQGFNMLSIARMAGHEEIDSQYSYYSHADHFAQSYVYRMAQRRLENSVSRKIDKGIIGWKRYVYDKGKTLQLNDDCDFESIVGRVKFGYCTEAKSVFPDTCIEYCEYCPNFYFNPAINEEKEAISWLSNTSKSLDRKIRESIELMRDLSMGLTNSYTQGNNDLLKSTSRKLMNYMDMKATIDSNLIGADAFVKQ